MLFAVPAFAAAPEFPLMAAASDYVSETPIQLFGMACMQALPYAVVFALGERVVKLVLGMAFRGRIEV